MNSCNFVVRCVELANVMTSQSGTKWATMRVCLNNYRKLPDGKTESKPCWMDFKFFNGIVDRAATIKKGDRFAAECHVLLDEWIDRATQEKRSKIRFVCNRLTYLEKRHDENEQVGDPHEAYVEPPSTPSTVTAEAATADVPF